MSNIDETNPIEYLTHVQILFNDEPAPETTTSSNEDRPAAPVELPRRTPISEIPKWGISRVAIRSANPLEESL